MNIYEVGKELLENPYSVYRADVMGINKYAYASWNGEEMQFCDKYRNFEGFVIVEIDEGTIQAYWEKIYNLEEIIDEFYKCHETPDSSEEEIAKALDMVKKK